MKINRSWHKKQIEKYKKEYVVYKEYAETLRRILEAACKIHASLAVVQARPKSLSSFGEKAVRKAHKYSSPITQLTDLCGARVITTTEEEAHRICGFINEEFQVDRPNSLDVRTRLRSSEFGYLSYHYVVELGDKPILGFRIPRAIQGRKAEIQVRTLLQHAWASISHDRIYKSQFKVPEFLHRNLARIAALLEQADDEFDSAVRKVEAYKLHYGAYMSPAQMKDEIETLRLILKNEPAESQKPAIALHIAHIAKAAWDWETVDETLQPFVGIAGCKQQEILLEHGHALCRMSCRSSRGRKFARGQKELTEASTGADRKLRAKALGYLAWSFGQIPGRERKAAELHRQAYELAPDDPYLLCSWLEFEIIGRKSLDLLILNRQTIISALETCRAHVEAGIELPWAFFTMGKLHLILGEPYESFAAYAQAIHLLTTEHPDRVAEILECESGCLDHFGIAKDLDPGRKWADDFLLLAKSVLAEKPTGIPKAPLKAIEKLKLLKPVVIIAGESKPASAAKYREIHISLSHTLRNFRGTIISGGTAQGIPGMVGDIAASLRGKNKIGFKLIGYLPRALPPGVTADKRYDKRVMTSSSGFSAEQPLRYWEDIITSGIEPGEVRLLAIGGGSLTGFECRLALALGATVGILTSKGVMTNDIYHDTDKWKEGRLLLLPDDKQTLKAFINPGESALSREQVDKLGEEVHNNYLTENRRKSADPAMTAWADLREDLKDSNRQQAIHAEDTLRQAGFGLRPAKAKPSSPKFSDDEVELMAEAEHGRWNVERLRSGWRFGPRRDPVNKLSPYLVPWHALAEDIKDYDRRAVWNWAKLFRDAGMEIYRLR
jgi:ppGpp synthetase/RelA/SpoT-type nucleotidyltranferase